MDLSRSDRQWAWFITGVGVVTAIVLVGEIVAGALGSGRLPDGTIVGFLTSIPFILGLLYAGYWLDRSMIPRSRYRRIALWFGAGLLGFLLINSLIMLTIPPESGLMIVGWVRWASVIGGGIGLLVGVFEATAIENELAVERAQRRQEELARQNQRLDEFASIVSHDLRNPLTVARNRLELTQDECDSEHLEDIERALERMETLIDDLLTLARAGLPISEMDPVSLASVLDACWSTVETTNARVEIDVDSTIEADRSRLQQLFENLLRNAITHGGDDVMVTVGELDDGFFVEDDGPGIPEDVRDDVFDAGFSTESDGTGFGLSIVQRIAEAHGWTVRVTEGSDGGARFEFTGVERLENA